MRQICLIKEKIEFQWHLLVCNVTMHFSSDLGLDISCPLEKLIVTQYSVAGTRLGMTTLLTFFRFPGISPSTLMVSRWLFLNRWIRYSLMLVQCHVSSGGSYTKKTPALYNKVFTALYSLLIEYYPSACVNFSSMNWRHHTDFIFGEFVSSLIKSILNHFFLIHLSNSSPFIFLLWSTADFSDFVVLFALYWEIEI